MWNQSFNDLKWKTIIIPKEKMGFIRSTVQRKLDDDINKVFNIAKNNRRVFRLELTSGRVLRFEKPRRTNREESIVRTQEFASHHDVGIPKVILSFIAKKHIYKFSEWIDGKLLREVIHLDEPFIKLGETVGKLNTLKNPKTNLYLTNGEVSRTNVIWTKDEKIYIIDHGQLKEKKIKAIDSSNIKSLLKRLINKRERDLFLKGYARYRDPSGIIKMAEDRNWVWIKNKGV